MYNKAILVGRLTADPELKQTPSGVSVTTFSIAVQRSYKSNDGTYVTDFIDIVAWRNTAEFICRYFSKGRPILVDGSIQIRTYTDKNGNNRRAWEVVASSAHFVESKSAASADANYSEPAPQTTQSNTDDFAEIDDDGDLPWD